MKKLCVLIAVLFMSTTAMARTGQVLLEMNVNADAYYKQIDSNTYVKDHDLITGNINVKVRIGLQSDSVNIPLNKRDDEKEGRKEIKILDKSAIQIVDKRDVVIDENSGEIYHMDIDRMAPAKIKMKKGELKSIKIKAETMKGIYAEYYNKVGLNVIEKLNIKAREAEVKSSLDFSDVQCEKEAGSSIMKCQEKLKLILDIKVRS